jgi:hypothetical protein
MITEPSSGPLRIGVQDNSRLLTEFHSEFTAGASPVKDEFTRYEGQSDSEVVCHEAAENVDTIDQNDTCYLQERSVLVNHCQSD